MKLNPSCAALIFLMLLAGCGSGGGSQDSAEDELDDPAFESGAADSPVVDSTAILQSSRPAALLLEESFDGGAFNPLWSDAGVNQEIYGQFNQPAFVEMSGHGDVLHYFVPQGQDEVTPAQIGVSGEGGFASIAGQPSVEEFYIEWSEYFPAGHNFARNGQKLLRATYWKEGEGQGLELTWAVLNSNGDLQLFLYHPQGQTDGGVLDLGLNTERGIPVNEWVRFGIWAKMNTPGTSDGFVLVEMNGQPLVRRAGMSLRGGDDRGWNILWIGGNHSNGGPTDASSDRYIDDIKLFSSMPR